MKPSQIYGLMKICDVTAEQVARAAETSVDTVFRSIRGERNGPDAQRAMEELAKALDLPIEAIREEEGAA